MKKENRKRKSFTFFKKHKKIAILLICIALFISSFAFINYSRYVKDIIQTYYLRSKNFYFNSNRLTLDNKNYRSNPWVINDDPYEISISMNSKLNNIKVMKADLYYTASCRVIMDGEESNVASCFIKGTTDSSMDRMIPGSENGTALEKNIDNFNIVVVPAPGNNLTDGDKVYIEITTEATAPYHQTLQATFELVVGNYGVTYEVDDQVGRRYLDFIVTNTLPDQRKIIVLEIKEGAPVVFDQNNAILDKIKNYGEAAIEQYGFGTYTDDDGYINKIIFRVDEKSSNLVRFYKKDLTDNFTFTSNSFNENVRSEIFDISIYTESEYQRPDRPTPDPDPDPNTGEEDEEDEEEENNEPSNPEPPGESSGSDPEE